MAAEAFVLLILMTSWLTGLEGKDQRELQLLELFAGQARVTRIGKACGIPSEAHDFDYDPKAKSSKGLLNNAFDITGPSGLVILNYNNIFCLGQPSHPMVRVFALPAFYL